jgi:hypothetical protein
MRDLTKAITSLHPTAVWQLNGDEYSGLVWMSEDIQKPTEAELEAEGIRLQAEYDAKQYARKRATEYPSIGDQLDALFHAGVFPEAMAAQIQAIKDKYPKS